MTAGLTVFSDSGTLQINQDYVTYGLDKKEVGVKNTELSYNGFKVLTPTVPGDYILVGKEVQDKPVDIYYFNTASKSTTSCGLEVYNSDGTVAFNSNSVPIRIIDFVRRKSTNSSGAAGDISVLTKTYTGYKKLGVIVSNYSAVLIVIGGMAVPKLNVYYPRIRISSDTIEFSYYQKLTTTRGAVSVLNAYLDFLIVDLSDY